MEVDAVVAGHGCVDVQPMFPPGFAGKLFEPGSLTDVGLSRFSLGGMIKTGPVMDRLGISTAVMGAYGDDEWGSILLGLIQRCNPRLAQGMIKVRKESTSYSFVIQPPGRDRAFAHHRGINDRFGSNLLNYAMIAKARLFLFGYLTLMRRMYQDNGSNARAMFSRVRAKGTTTALDVTMIDPTSEAGKLSWCQILANVLPEVDVFMPSYNEIIRLLGLQVKGKTSGFNVDLLRAAAEMIIEMGTAIVGIKLGELGCYIRVTDDVKRLRQAGRALTEKQIANFRGKEMFVPAFNVSARNTNGAGDYWIGGFLAALLKGWSLERAAWLGNACGTYRVLAADPNEASPKMASLRARMNQWSPITSRLPASLMSWPVNACRDPYRPIYIGPDDIRLRP